MSEGKTLKEIALELLEKYRRSETGLIWEMSGSISEDITKLEYECNYIRKQIERMPLTVDQSMNVLHLPYVEMPKWIPVTERLPETSEKVLITRRFGLYVGDDYDRCIDLGHYYSNLKQWDTLYLDDIEVLAWMPLPEPYKGGDAE